MNRAPTASRSGGRDLFTVLVMISVALLPLQLPATETTRLAPADPAIALALLVGVGRLAVRHRSMIVTAALFPLLALFGLIVGLMTADVVPPNGYVRAIGAFLLVGSVLCWQAAARQLDDGICRLVRIFVVAGLVIGLLTFIEARILGMELLTEQKVAQRFGGGLYDPNHFAAMTALSLVLTIGLGSRLFTSRSTYWLVAGGHACMLALSISRGGWIACLAGLLVLVVRAPKVRIKPALVALVAAAALALVASGAAATAINDFENRPDNVGSRATLNEQAITDFEESSFLGLGLMVGFEKYDQIVHNSLLWALSDLGVLGVVWFLSWNFEILVRLRNLRLRSLGDLSALVPTLLAAHVTMLVASMGVEAVFQRHWWFVIALIVALSAEQQRPTASPVDRPAAERVATA